LLGTSPDNINTTVSRIIYDLDGSYPLLDELIADDDGGLDGVGVHDLGGVIQADILGQVQVLVVNMLKYKKTGLQINH
jgi:hypothetical protein